MQTIKYDREVESEKDTELERVCWFLDRGSRDTGDDCPEERDEGG